MKETVPMKEKESHHWWPKCISEHWKDNRGYVYKLSSDRAEPEPLKNNERFGFTPNAHSIKLPHVISEGVMVQLHNNDADEKWKDDECFEHFFQLHDNNNGFKHIFKWLKILENEQENLDILLECLLSLVVRSPSFFRQITSDMENLTIQEEHTIKINIRDALKNFRRKLFYDDIVWGRQKERRGKNAVGKFGILFSKEQEFIYGDGFVHNFTSCIAPPTEPKMIVPLLPNICVCYFHLTRTTNPRLSTVELKKDEVDFINRKTIEYSKECVFYKSNKPENQYFGKYMPCDVDSKDLEINNFLCRVLNIKTNLIAGLYY
jgi:hypothetical protein